MPQINSGRKLSRSDPTRFRDHRFSLNFSTWPSGRPPRERREAAERRKAHDCETVCLQATRLSPRLRSCLAAGMCASRLSRQCTYVAIGWVPLFCGAALDAR